MTVQNQNITSGPYTGNGLSDTFNYDWKIDSSNQLIVLMTDDLGVQTTLTNITDYIVNDIGEDGGGSITLVNGPLLDDYQLFIRSNFLPVQLFEFSSQGSFLPENHEFAFDKLTRLIQQLIYQGTLTLSFNDNTINQEFNPELPAPNVAGGYLRIRPDLTGLEWVVGNGIDTDAPIDFTNLTINGGQTVISNQNLFQQAQPPVTDSGTSIDLPLAAQSVGLVCTNASPVTVTIQPDSTTAFPVGAVVPIYQEGSGQVTVEGGSGVAVETADSDTPVILERRAFATAWQRALNVWVISGKLVAA